MIILGIDPGYAILGYGVLEADGRKVRPLDYGVVETKVGTPFPERLDMLYAGVNELLRLYKPDCAVFEELFFYHNATTAIQVGAGRGVAKLAGPLAMAYSEPSIRPKISQNHLAAVLLQRGADSTDGYSHARQHAKARRRRATGSAPPRHQRPAAE